MKSIRSFLIGIFVTGSLAASLHLLPAQEAAPISGGTDSTVDWSSASDLEVELQAVESLPTIPATAAPQAGTFYSAQHAPGSAEPWPPMPANIRDVPLWSLGDNIFLLSDLTVNYDQPIKSKTMAKSGGMMTMEDVDLSPGDGDTNDDGGGYTNNVQFTPINTNGLWLQITNVSGGVAYLNLMNATDSVYEVMSKENLLATDWDIIGELFPTNATTNVMPFTVAANSPTNLFVWAMDWTGVTSDGNTTPKWWFWKYFGTTGLSDTNLDSTGNNTLGYDYTNGVDPNVISFLLQFTNLYPVASTVYGGIDIQGGVPGYEAILINDTNLADASWQPCTSTNVMVSLNSGNGRYTVYVGLRGLPADAQQTWMNAGLTLYSVPVMLAVTNPAGGTVSTPMIQLQGLVNESLGNLTFDVSNAVGVVTNEQGYWNPAFYDTNLLEFTTNTFQCYDIPLTSGINIITLHATDLEGNSTTTNFSYTLSYAGVTNAPVLSLIWPTNNTLIGGSNVTIQAQINDATATVTATVNGNTIPGLVERSGLVWLQNVPLNTGTNVVTITSQNAAGKVSTNTLDVVQSSVNLSIDPISDDQLNQTNVTVTGSVSDPAADVWVNGMEVEWCDDNDWYADNVPVNATGTAIINVEAGTDLSHVIASQTLSQAQPALVVSSGYSNVENDQYYETGEDGREIYDAKSSVVDWSCSSGGNYADWGVGSFNVYPYYVSYPSYSGDVPTNAVFGPPWEYALLNNAGDEDVTKTTRSTVMIVPPGQVAAGTSALYLVMAGASDFSDVNGFDGWPDSYPPDELYDAGDLPMPPEWLAVNGQSLVNAGITNADGSVEGLALVSAPVGMDVPLTLSATQFHYYADATFTNVLAQAMHLSIIDTNSGTDLTLQTNTVIVGQQMNWQARLSITNSYMTNWPLANFQWTIPGYAISNYVVAADGSSAVVVTNFSTVNSNIVFYWVDGASNRTVQCSATVNGKTITAQAVFNIYRPTVTVTTLTGTVALNYIPYAIPWLHFGVPETGYQPGIQLTNNSFTMPSGNYNYGNTNGTTEWVQEVISSLRRQQTNDGSGAWYRIQVTNPVLDTLYPIPFPEDSPNSGDLSDYKAVSYSDSFQTWLMFKPNGGQWVPLKVVSWSWSGVGTNDVGANWTLISSSNSTNPPDAYTTTYPTWSNNVTNFVMQKE